MANGDFHHVYNCARWQRLRRQILARDGWRCRLCGATLRAGTKARRGNAAVDHITSMSQGGDPWLPSNLRAICSTCNAVLSNSKVPRVVERRYDQRRAW